MHSLIAKISIALLLSTLAACAATPGHVRQGKPVAEINNERGLALQGYDPVAYFREGKPVVGDAAIAHAWHGATYRFTSVANRDAFAADPFIERIIGKELKDEFIRYKREEWTEYHQTVSQWEIDRYARLF